MFEAPGTENTIPTLNLAKSNADECGITSIVIASTRGITIQEAVKILDPQQYSIVCVLHNYGFNEEVEQEFPGELRAELSQQGVKFVIGTLPFSGIGSTLARKYQLLDPPTLFARLTRTILGDGVKVSIEIVVMAVDAGAIPQNTEVIAIAGTGTGADTCCLIRSASSRYFENLRVEAILAKPKVSREG